MISFRAPELCQFADEEILLAMGAILDPGLLDRRDGENGLRIWVPGDATDDDAPRIAVARFQVVLGALRAWRSVAGELREEQLGGLGPGAARDQAGNQWLKVGTAIDYRISDGEIEAFSDSAALAVGASTRFAAALRLHGRASRTAAEFYMIDEYARQDLGHPAGIEKRLGIPQKDQKLFRNSACNLSPFDGGRHAGQRHDAPWTLEEQRTFIGSLLRAWMAYLVAGSRSASGSVAR